MRLSSAFGKPASIATRIRVTDKIDIVANLPEGQASHEMEIVEKLGALPSPGAGNVSLPHPTPQGVRRTPLLRRAIGSTSPAGGKWRRHAVYTRPSRDLCPD